MRRLVFGALGLFATAAWPLDFRSIGEVPAVLYGGPSQKTEKLYVVSVASPVEVISAIDGWAKVRTVGGEIAWVESGALAARRTVAVTAPVAAIRAAPAYTAAVVVSARKGVVLELLDGTGAWARVRHRDGAQGYLRNDQIWGL